MKNFETPEVKRYPLVIKDEITKLDLNGNYEPDPTSGDVLDPDDFT